jgi:uncharacterized membrane protein
VKVHKGGQTVGFAVGIPFLLVLLVCSVMAHDKHPTPSPNPTPSIEQPGATIEKTIQPLVEPARGRVDRFPTLHPLVVHFPIMLLLLAATLQIVALFVFKREIGWIVLSMTILGCIGAYLASNVFHPHTTGLTEIAQRLLLEHELYAQVTFWFALAAAFAKGVSIYFNRPLWGEVPAIILLIVAAGAVTFAGHHGAELVHKEGVGPQGRFLEVDHDH